LVVLPKAGRSVGLESLLFVGPWCCSERTRGPVSVTLSEPAAQHGSGRGGTTRRGERSYRHVLSMDVLVFTAESATSQVRLRLEAGWLLGACARRLGRLLKVA
jgi:hypothetical protein